MTTRRLVCAFLGLSFGLLFYLAFRSDQTVSNRLVRILCGPSNYFQLKNGLRHGLPVPRVLRGCLPSALWCLIATSLIGAWRLRLSESIVLRLGWWPPVFNAGWEMVQWAGWTHGRADWQDVIAGFVGWMVGVVLVSRPATAPEEIPSLGNWRVGVVIAGFTCMGFAYVWK